MLHDRLFRSCVRLARSVYEIEKRLRALSWTMQRILFRSAKTIFRQSCRDLCSPGIEQSIPFAALYMIESLHDDIDADHIAPRLQ